MEAGMHEVQRIGVVSLAKYTAVIPAVMALVFALPMLILEAVIPGGGVAIYLMTVIGTLIAGAISGAITALIYNLLASVIGGVELELGQV